MYTKDHERTVELLNHIATVNQKEERINYE